MDPLFRRTTSVAKRVNVEISLASSTISEYIEKYDETLIFRERFLAQCYYGFIEYALNGVIAVESFLYYCIQYLMYRMKSGRFHHMASLQDKGPSIRNSFFSTVSSKFPKINDRCVSMR